MQSIRWYLRRLRTMGPREILWRVRGSLSARVDRLRLTARGRPRPWSALTVCGGDPGDPGFHVPWAATAPSPGPPAEVGLEGAWLDALVRQADLAMAGRLSFFDQEGISLGDPIDWNRDPKHRVACPMAFAGKVDYRDFAEVGDCKFVWEPNRHHHLVVLARAYRATGQQRYARAVVAQIESWLDQNPYGRGMNWRSPMELAIRLISWVWAVDLIGHSGLVAGEFRRRLYDSAHRHLWEVARKFSRGSSANNHVIGEAAGVFIAAGYFADLRGAAGWRHKSRAILLDEARRQTFADGGNKEQAIGYHLFVLQFLVLAGLVARWRGEEFPGSYWSCVAEMLDYLATLAEGGDALPMYGDADDGYVLDVGAGATDWRQWLALGAVLLDRPQWKVPAGEYSQTAHWLLGPPGQGQWDASPSPAPRPLASRALAETGYYLLQCGHEAGADGDDRISAMLDAGPLGYLSIAPHGHADALAVVVRAFGQDVLVDPGTYDYFTYPKWRAYFRGTRAHNTVIVDGQDQSEILGPFMWGRRAEARCLAWEPAAGGGGKLVAEHDGYTRLDDPVRHRRTLSLDAAARVLVIQDDLIAQGAHDVEVLLHFSEQCTLRREGDCRWHVELADGRWATLGLDPRLTVEERTAREDPPCGWVSRGYHRRRPATTLVCKAQTEGETSLTCRLEFGPAEGV